MPTPDAAAAYLRLVRDEDTLQTTRDLSDEVLLHLGSGLALAAYRGDFDSTTWTARTFYGIPADVLELAAAAYLTTCAPSLGAVILARPNDATLLALRAALRDAGLDARPEPPALFDEVLG